MNIKNSNNAITQILAASLLLIMAMVVMSMVYMYYLSYPPPNSPPNVNIAGFTELNNIVLEHRGGDPLGLNTNVQLVIDSNVSSFKIGDSNYMEEKDKSDGRWDIGERVVFVPSVNITNLRVEAFVNDIYTNELIFNGVIQQGV